MNTKPHPFHAVTVEIARTLSRESLIDWLVWHDPNGVYQDEHSQREFGNVLSKEEALEIVIRQIQENE